MSTRLMSGLEEACFAFWLCSNWWLACYGAFVADLLPAGRPFNARRYFRGGVFMMCSLPCSKRWSRTSCTRRNQLCRAVLLRDTPVCSDCLDRHIGSRHLTPPDELEGLQLNAKLQPASLEPSCGRQTHMIHAFREDLTKWDLQRMEQEAVPLWKEGCSCSRLSHSLFFVDCQSDSGHHRREV